MVELVDKIRVRLEGYIYSNMNTRGCLLGKLDEYMETYGIQVERLQARFRKNSESWEAQVRRTAETSKRKIAKLLSTCQNV